MARLTSWALLCLSAFAVAQRPSASKRLLIELPPGVPSESVNIEYALEGSFGSHGNYAKPKPNEAVYTIAVPREEELAERWKAVIWARGCEFRTYDVDLRRSTQPQISYECVAAPDVMLTGRLLLNESLRKNPQEIRVWYLASWACGFFGWGDCMVPQFPVATVTAGPDGTFAIKLPDFGKKPRGVSGTWATVDDSFEFLLVDAVTQNHIAELRPEMQEVSSADHCLRVLSAYPSDLAFVPVIRQDSP